MPSPRKRSTTKSAKQSEPLPVPVISQEEGVMTLHFESDYIQSQMVVGEPDFLALAYTRTMMAFETLVPQPSEIALLGLGGGSIAKWCYRHHPKTRITVVEINPHVIAVREAFHIPPDNDRFHIYCQDGSKFVAGHSNRFEVLLIDCFVEDHLPPELGSQQFHDNCAGVLTEGGLLVTNLFGRKHKGMISKIRKSFDGQVLLATGEDGNTVVFACKGKSPWPKTEGAAWFRRKLRKFERKYALGKALAAKG